MKRWTSLALLSVALAACGQNLQSAELSPQVSTAGRGAVKPPRPGVLPTLTATVVGSTGVYQDRHGNVAVTLVNTNKKFSGELTFKLTSHESVDEFTGTHYRLESASTTIKGAGTFQRTLSVYMPPQASVREMSADYPFPDALVVYAQGVEVSRVPLQVYPLEQQIAFSIPQDTYTVHAGETINVPVAVTVTPGGETLGASFFCTKDFTVPDWLEVSGNGETPKEGGTGSIQVTATGAPAAGEASEVNVGLYCNEGNFGHQYKANLGFVPSFNLRFVP